MKKNKIAVVSMLLGIAMLLGACDNTEATKETTTTIATATGEKSDSTTNENVNGVVFTDGISGVNQFPFVDTPTEFVIAFPYAPAILDVDTNEQALHLEEISGLDIIWDILPEAGYDEKINLMIAGGSALPDLFASVGTFSTSMLATLGSQGIVAPLEDLIEKWQYNFAQLVEEHPNVLTQSTSPDGHIYFVPSYGSNEPNKFSQRFWINQNFLDALDLNMPQTTEEYYDYLVAVKHDDPNGNGKEDEIPLAAAPVNSGWQEHIDGFLLMPFIYMDTTNTQSAAGRRRIFMSPEGTVEYACVQEGYKEGLKYLHRLFEEGLMSSDVFTMAKEDLRSLVEFEEAEIIGSLPCGGPHDFANTSGERRKSYVIVPPLEGPDGTRQTYWEEYAGVTTGTYVIPTASEKKDIAMKLIDYMFTEEMRMWSRYGVEDRDWKRPDDGVKAWDGGQAMVDVTIGNLVWGETQNVHLVNRMPGWSRFASHANVDTGDPYNLEKVLWDAHLEYKPYITNQRVPPLLYTEAEGREYSELFNTLHLYVEQMQAEFITGQRDIDTEWDSFVEECNKIGLPRILEINQTAFDRQWADSWKATYFQ